MFINHFCGMTGDTYIAISASLAFLKDRQDGVLQELEVPGKPRFQVVKDLMVEFIG